MTEIQKWLMVIVVLLALIFFYTKIYDNTDYFVSNIDGKDYRVRGTEEMKKIKSNLIANLYGKLSFLVSTLKNDNNIEPVFAKPVGQLLSNWSYVTIKEVGIMESDAAYVINKRHMSICLKNFCDELSCSNNNLDVINLMTYVGIHESAHIMSEEVGHGSEFITNFKFLLKYAKKLKYFDKILNQEIPLYIDLTELKDTPNNYCGVSIINSIS